MTYEEFLKKSKLSEYDKTFENYQIWLGIFDYCYIREKYDTQKCIEEADSSTMADMHLSNREKTEMAIIDQLKNGTHTNRHSGESNAPWVIEIYEQSDVYGQYNINQILFWLIRTKDIDLRMEVLNVLQMKSEILTAPQYNYLLENFLHLFAGQRHSLDPVGRNRGSDFVVLTSSKGDRDKATEIVRKFVFDPKFTYSCLPELIYRDKKWLAENISKIREIVSDQPELDRFLDKYKFSTQDITK